MKKKILAVFMTLAMTLGFVSPAFAAGLSSAEQSLLNDFKAELNYWKTEAQLDDDHINQYYSQAEKALNAVDLSDEGCEEFRGVLKESRTILAGSKTRSDLYSHEAELSNKINAVGDKYYKLHVTVNKNDKYATVTWEVPSADGTTKKSTAASTGSTVKQTGFDLGQTAIVAGASVAVLAGAFVVARKKQLFVA